MHIGSLMERDQRILELKNEIQTAMTHKLGILREVLSTLKQEQAALLSEDHNAVKASARNRLQLISSLNEWNRRFYPAVKKLGDLLDKSAPDNSQETLLDQVQVLAKFLDDDDFELLLLRDQLSEVVEEIKKQTSFTLNYLENKPPNELLMHYNSAINDFSAFLANKEYSPKKVLIGLMEKGQKEIG